MSNPFYHLTLENKEHVIKYLKFFRAKKDSILRALGNEFEDAKADRWAISSSPFFCELCESILHSLTVFYNILAKTD
jgi:hypothetical protein